MIKATSRFVDEILVISDGSTDNTTNIAKNAGATVIDNILNHGLGRTTQRSYAIKHGSDIVSATRLAWKPIYSCNTIILS